MEIKLKSIISLLVISATSLSINTANAENTIIFNGAVSDTTCAVVLTGGASTIELGATSVADLTANNMGAPKSFSFAFTGCPAVADGGYGTAKMTFSGNSDTNPDYFKNEAASDPATGVAIVILDGAGTVVKNNTAGSNIDVSSGGVTVPYTARLVKSGAAAPTKGPVQTTVTYNVTYQ